MDAFLDHDESSCVERRGIEVNASTALRAHGCLPESQRCSAGGILGVLDTNTMPRSNCCRHVAVRQTIRTGDPRRKYRVGKVYTYAVRRT